ncbi:hypothetical protein BDR26DRAFT_859959 [Obelidium mucronatum]|nr:hypothetical protein BDR26DRAFT_859959 [Obelidium mucronatum]
MTPNDLTAIYLGTTAVLVSLSIVDRTKPIQSLNLNTAEKGSSDKLDSFLVRFYSKNQRIQRALATCVIASGLLQMFDVLIGRPELFQQPWSTAQRRAAFLAYGSILLRLWSMGTLNNDFTFTVTAPPSKKLCTTGPYEMLMHPGYVGVIGWSFFQCAWLFDEKAPYVEIITRGIQTMVKYKANPLILLVSLELDKLFDLVWVCFTVALVLTTALLPPGIIRRIKREEEELKLAFGKDFEEYRAKRWRLIPFIY